MTSSPPPPLTNQDVIEIWKQTVSVQQHFNDIALKIRNLAMTFLAAVVAGIGLSLKDKLSIDFIGVQIPVAIIICIGGIIIIQAFLFMDRYWYHQLLMGSVQYGEYLEKEYPHIFGQIGLTSQISASSKVNYNNKVISSSDKFTIFYRNYLTRSLYVLLAVLSIPPVIEALLRLRDCSC